MSFNLYFTGVLTGLTLTAFLYSGLLEEKQVFWRRFWAFAFGGMTAISVLYFAGFERAVVGVYYFVFMWLVLIPVYRALGRAPSTLKLPWYLKAWFYGVPPLLGIRLGMQVIHYTNGLERGSLFWSGVAVSAFTVTVYVWLFRRLNRTIARERALIAMFPDMKDF